VLNLTLSAFEGLAEDAKYIEHLGKYGQIAGDLSKKLGFIDLAKDSAATTEEFLKIFTADSWEDKILAAAQTIASATDVAYDAVGIFVSKTFGGDVQVEVAKQTRNMVSDKLISMVDYLRSKTTGLSGQYYRQIQKVAQDLAKQRESLSWEYLALYSSGLKRDINADLDKLAAEREKMRADLLELRKSFGLGVASRTLALLKDIDHVLHLIDMETRDFQEKFVARLQDFGRAQAEARAEEKRIKQELEEIYKNKKSGIARIRNGIEYDEGLGRDNRRIQEVFKDIEQQVLRGKMEFDEEAITTLAYQHLEEEIAHHRERERAIVDIAQELGLNLDEALAWLREDHYIQKLRKGWDEYTDESFRNTIRTNLERRMKFLRDEEERLAELEREFFEKEREKRELAARERELERELAEKERREIEEAHQKMLADKMQVIEALHKSGLEGPGAGSNPPGTNPPGANPGAGNPPPPGAGNDTELWHGGFNLGLLATRDPNGVTAQQVSGGGLASTLRYPGEADVNFTMNPSTAYKTSVNGREYYLGSITDADAFFGYTLTSARFDTNSEKDFFRFALISSGTSANHNDGNRYGAFLSGYYGVRLNAASKLFDNGVSIYHLAGFPATVSSSQSNLGNTKMFINWATGKAYGVAPNGSELFVGDIDRNNFELTGQYIALGRTNNAPSATHFSRNTTDHAATFQFYGRHAPNAIGGIFGIAHHDNAGSVIDLNTQQLSGYLDRQSVNTAYAPSNNEVWKGFASGFITFHEVIASTGFRDLVGGASIYNSDPNDLQITLRPESGAAKVRLAVHEKDKNISYGFASDWTDASAYVNKNAFAVIKDVNSLPSHIATHTDASDAYDYLSWGSWSMDMSATPNTEFVNDHRSSRWIAGMMTPTTDMPTSGTATYAGQIQGHAIKYESVADVLTGTIGLTANFGTGDVTGQLNIQSHGTAYATSNLSGVSITHNHFSGNLSGSDHTGKINGAFYGPNAQEVGGNWIIENNNQYDKASGIFAAKK